MTEINYQEIVRSMAVDIANLTIRAHTAEQQVKQLTQALTSHGEAEEPFDKAVSEG